VSLALVKLFARMPKFKFPRKLTNQNGYTLLEVTIAAAISGLMFLALMGLLSQTTEFATYFHGSAASIEASADAISQLNAIMPQVVKIRSCGCHGVADTTLSDCTWNEPTGAEPNIGKDPIQNFGGSNTDPGLEIFKGDFEWFNGNAPATGNTFLTGLLTSNIGGGSAGSLGACQSTSSFTVAGVAAPTFPKGCKLEVRLIYKSPVDVIAGAKSIPGALKIYIGNQNSAIVTSPHPGTWIGQTDTRGGTPIGVTQLSCGFVQSGSTAQSSGQLFALNLKIKSRASSEQNTSGNTYESWYPGGTNYNRGLVRDLRFKYSFRNISSRGAYQWRAQGKRKCITNGNTAVDKSECCSMAISGTTCTVCKPKGTGGAASACCSEQISAGVCL
jgi:type II secretory pathway pseudopilin PulG